MAATKVFISYAHESSALSDFVLKLANDLRKNNIDAEIDQYEESPPEGWPKWMMRQIQEAEYVLVFCSKLFYDRANDFSGGSQGLGAKWETSLILQQLYEANTNNSKYIPVIINKDSSVFIPLPLKPYTYYNLENADDKERLLNRLKGQSKSKRPILGQDGENEPLPQKERKTLFLTTIINLELWNKASWNGMAFISDPSLRRPPIVGFVFDDDKAGNEIFAELKAQFGQADKDEEIRLSFISGISDANPQNYKVHIGTSFDSFKKKIDDNELDQENTLVMSVSRIHQMTPPKDSKNIEVFKHSFNYFKKYYITNILGGQSNPRPNFDHLIEKTKIHFRSKSEIGENKNDEDYVVFNKTKT